MGRSTQRPKAIQDLLKRGSAALKKEDWFQAEELLSKATGMLRSRMEWGCLADTIEQQHTARKGRRKAALASRSAIRIIEEDPGDKPDIERGRVLFQPPMVGADARRYGLEARAQEVAVAVICREPTTQLGEIPVVAIAPGATVRVKIDPPKSESKPSAAWFRSAIDALGQEAVAMDQIDLETPKRVDRLLALIDAVPDSVAPHERLVEVCREAADHA